ncbi:hypothetical protein G3446_20245 [Thiorhodococcus minor]|uniref:Uncharacterized protein n=1 Tax=Thiorhodococcus minor TaxID=57489 RepID=A0A6M0K6G1_9GAMM|nr:hypothetical protein [Thiorhodococcus minor]
MGLEQRQQLEHMHGCLGIAILGLLRQTGDRHVDRSEQLDDMLALRLQQRPQLRQSLGKVVRRLQAVVAGRGAIPRKLDSLLQSGNRA